MHVVQRPVRQRIHRRMYLPSERQIMNGVGLGSGTRYVAGLGEVDGLFNIGKMFKRMTKFTPSSFKLKNIMGALGSATMFTATGGLISLAPKTLSAKSKVSQIVGYGTAAVAAVAGGAALLPAGALTSIGGGLATGLKTVASVFPVASQVLGGSRGGQQQQQDDSYAQQYASQQAYAAQIEAQRSQMYMPGMIPDSSGMIPPTIGQPGTMQTAYGDLRSPYTAISEDGQQTLQIDPRTGQVIQAGMLPDLSMTTWLAIGGVTVLAGWYFMSDSKRIN